MSWYSALFSTCLTSLGQDAATHVLGMTLTSWEITGGVEAMFEFSWIGGIGPFRVRLLVRWLFEDNGYLETGIAAQLEEQLTFFARERRLPGPFANKIANEQTRLQTGNE